MSQRKKSSHFKPNDVAVFALGGLGEVGKNMYWYNIRMKFVLLMQELNSQRIIY